MASGLFWSAAIMFLAYGLLRFASTGAPQLRDAIFAPVSQDAQRLTAVQGFAHVQTLSLSFHQTKRTGAMNRIIDRGANAVAFWSSTSCPHWSSCRSPPSSRPCSMAGRSR